MQVGPYETVQLHSNDGSALTAWLTGHGYDIPDYTKPVVAAYVADGFDFLALKLVPGQGVQAMQPVRVTSMGAAPSLPLHMVAVGTGPVTGITIWIVADGRWEPSNFPTFTIQSSELAWDWLTSSSNYEQVRLNKEAELSGRGWQIESSLELNQYRIEEQLLQNVQYDTNQVGGYGPSPSADAGVRADAAATDAGADAAARDGAAAPHDSGRDTSAAEGADSGNDSATGEFYDFDAGEYDGDYGNPVIPMNHATEAAAADLAVLFAGIAAPNVRITRMRSDVAKSALSVDMYLQAAANQAELSNELLPTQEIGEPYCPIYNGNCQQTGTAPRSQAVASSGNGNGCSTATPRNEVGSTLCFLVAFGGVAAVRARRRRRRSAR